jgi:hypothetical protein
MYRASKAHDKTQFLGHEQDSCNLQSWKDIFSEKATIPVWRRRTWRRRDGQEQQESVDQDDPREARRRGGRAGRVRPTRPARRGGGSTASLWSGEVAGEAVSELEAAGRPHNLVVVAIRAEAGRALRNEPPSRRCRARL